MYIGKKQSGGSCLNVVYDRRSKVMAFARPDIMVDFGAWSTGEPAKHCKPTRANLQFLCD